MVQTRATDLPDDSRVVIIGGGPSGVCLARFLKRSGIDCVIFEQETVGSSWRNMADALKVISPLWTNTLPGSQCRLLESYSQPPAQQYAGYLERYVKKFEVDVTEGVEVLKVTGGDNHGDPFEITTNLGNVKASLVVCATGYYSNPYVPVLTQDNDGSIPFIHAAQYKNSAELKLSHHEARNILIVGKRVTAGQLMVELVQSGFTVSLSVRGPVKPRRGSLLGQIKDALYFPYEVVRIALQPALKSDSYPEMDGGEAKSLLDSGSVAVHPTIESVRYGAIIFSDGNIAAYDVVILATGYRPALDYLDEQVRLNKNGLPTTRNFESVEQAGLFFLGLDQLKNFRSRYLRGIRSDARRLTTIIRERLACL